MGVRIVNPETGREVAMGCTVTVAPGTTPGSTVTVQIRPSFRPGMDYDLGTYPATWIVDDDHPREDLRGMG